MEETVLQKDALLLAKKNMQAYSESHDVKYVAENAVFKNLNTGEEHRGRAEIGAMLHYMYHVAFDAKAEVTNLLVTEDHAVLEGYFKGRHIGEFAGIKPTEKEVDVPLCVTYDLKNGLITEGRIYMLVGVLFNQLGVAPSTAPSKVTYLVRDIFQLRFGHYREAKSLVDEAVAANLFPENVRRRFLTDFTGDAYRLIMEEGFDGLGEYETALTTDLGTEEFHKWYQKFIPHVESSHREILKQVL